MQQNISNYCRPRLLRVAKIRLALSILWIIRSQPALEFCKALELHYQHVPRGGRGPPIPELGGRVFCARRWSLPGPLPSIRQFVKMWQLTYLSPLIQRSVSAPMITVMRNYMSRFNTPKSHSSVFFILNKYFFHLSIWGSKSREPRFAEGQMHKCFFPLHIWLNCTTLWCLRGSGRSKIRKSILYRELNKFVFSRICNFSSVNFGAIRFVKRFG